MSRDFRSKLARLRRDGNAKAGRKGGLPDWARASLSKRKSTAASPQPPANADVIAARNAWPTTSGDPNALVEHARAEGTFAARTQRLPIVGTRHGDWHLDEIDAACPNAIAHLAKDDALRELDLSRAVYLDTETSGLSGGAGVYVFMVGLGWFEEGEYVSWQGFLRSPGEERALLAEVAERIEASSGVVSFFGKSFDRHRLEDKMRIAGVTPTFEGRPHLDLYHPFRRLTKNEFANGKLQTMERELLGFRRERDLPGSLAPEAWFDYLADRPHRLEGVFLHNHEDVLSLVTLAAMLGRTLDESRRDGADLPGPAARRAAAICETSSAPEDKLRWAECALERGLAGDDARRVQLLRADLLRRARRANEADSAYRRALEERRDDDVAIDLFVGLSMLCERDLKDREAALSAARDAASLATRLGRTRRQCEAIDARVKRLTP